MALQSTVFVYTMNLYGQKGSWSRYVFPFAIDYFTTLGNTLYMRSGNDVLAVDDTVFNDFEGDTGRQQPFDGVIQWGWLDFGAPGVTKMMVGFDLVGTGTVNVQFGYDQRDTSLYTTAWEIDADTLPGGVLFYPLSFTTVSTKLTFTGGERWSWQSFILYLNDFRMTS